MAIKTQNIEVQQFDNGIKLFFNIKKDGLTESIMGSEVTLKLMEKSKRIVLNRKCIITDEELGECLYILTTEDLGVHGTYDTEIQINYANGTILSLDNVFKLIVIPETIPRTNEGVVKKQVSKIGGVAYIR